MDWVSNSLQTVWFSNNNLFSYLQNKWSKGFVDSDSSNFDDDDDDDDNEGDDDEGADDDDQVADEDSNSCVEEIVLEIDVNKQQPSLTPTSPSPKKLRPSGNEVKMSSAVRVNVNVNAEAKRTSDDYCPPDDVEDVRSYFSFTSEPNIYQSRT